MTILRNTYKQLFRQSLKANDWFNDAYIDSLELSSHKI